ncbi:MAG: hypothetical protein FJ137_21225, partial [Deltaproteobacteria bacterium]|nr:hypothetical protein [Deltaproteobacteria bacterium]
MESTRRGFLSRAALGGGALVLSSGLYSLAGGGCASSTSLQRRTDHYFVFYFLVGGWDLMFVTDPVARKDGFWIPYDDNEVVEAGGVRLGPAMKPLLPFSHRMALLKGIHCDALNHPQARFRMVTGRFKPAGEVVAPSVQTLIAQKLGQAYELPNLSGDQLRPASFRGHVADLRLEPVRVSSVDQLKGLTNLKGDLGRYRREIEEALRKKDALTARRWQTPSSSELAPSFAAFADLERDLAQSDYRQRVQGATSLVEGAEQALGANRVGAQVRLAVEAVRQDLAPGI